MAPNKQSKKRVYKLVGIFLAGVLVFLAASSRNYIELHERLIIQGLGIDRTEQGYKVSVQSLKTTEEEKIELLVTEGDTVYDALNNLSLQIGKVPLYTHNIMVVIGRSAAEHGLDDVLDFLSGITKRDPPKVCLWLEIPLGNCLPTRRTDNIPC